eukprot:2046070-Pyramimonas_sp.AAC.1
MDLASPPHDHPRQLIHASPITHASSSSCHQIKPLSIPSKFPLHLTSSRLAAARLVVADATAVLEDAA